MPALGVVSLLLSLFLLFPPQIRTTVDLVVVPVTVKDSNGKLVTGLTKEDFVITEDGVEQTITDFDIDPQRLSAAIIVDDGMNGNLLRRLYPRFAPSVFVTLTSGFTPDDRMASFRYDRAVHKLSDFTNDPLAIGKSFDVLQEYARTRPDEKADMLAEKGPRWLRSMLNVLQTGNGSLRPADGALHDAIYAGAVALRDQDASHRKIILIISDGRVMGSNEHTFDQTVNLLLQNQIQVYGVSTQFATFGSFGQLTSYASATGGDVYPGTSTKSMETAFASITEQARYEYVLGYVSNNRPGTMGVFRTIAVRTRSPKQVVTHRKGYMQYPKP
jgi:Ca-activated chloride channel family protein